MSGDSSRSILGGILASVRYAVGWRVRDRPRPWVWSVFPSLGLAVRSARGHAALSVAAGGESAPHGLPGGLRLRSRRFWSLRLAMGLEMRRQD